VRRGDGAPRLDLALEAAEVVSKLPADITEPLRARTREEDPMSTAAVVYSLGAALHLLILGVVFLRSPYLEFSVPHTLATAIALSIFWFMLDAAIAIHWVRRLRGRP
jgi:hypothetical protein